MYNTITQDGFVNAPPCPSSHPVRVPQVTYETVWDTTQFNSMWPSNGQNPFVWSFEGISGYGTHADYMFGWKGDALKKAMSQSECFYDGCGSITKQDMSVANQCKVPQMVNENIDGCMCFRNVVNCNHSIANFCRGPPPSGHDFVDFAGTGFQSGNLDGGNTSSFQSLAPPCSELHSLSSSART